MSAQDNTQATNPWLAELKYFIENGLDFFGNYNTKKAAEALAEAEVAKAKAAQSQSKATLANALAGASANNAKLKTVALYGGAVLLGLAVLYLALRKR